MSARKLADLIPPPLQPTETGSDQEWEALQARLGTKLPEDWREFGTSYGTGTFVDRDQLDIWIFNPFSSGNEEKRKFQQANLEAMKIGEGDDYVPYPVFPEKAGLLALGDDVQGNEIYWLTAGRPEKWRIVVRSRGDDSFEEFDGPLLGFLSKVFRRELSVGVWPDPFFTNPKNLSFRPELPTPVQTEFPKTIYVLYAQNGNRAGFWVRHQAGREGMFYYVKAIDGKTEGLLSGIPEEYDRQPVLVDVHWNGEIFQTDLNPGDAHRPGYFRTEAPPTK